MRPLAMVIVRDTSPVQLAMFLSGGASMKIVAERESRLAKLEPCHLKPVREKVKRLALYYQRPNSTSTAVWNGWAYFLRVSTAIVGR